MVFQYTGFAHLLSDLSLSISYFGAIINDIFISISDCLLLLYGNTVNFIYIEIVSWILARGH